MPLLYFFSLSVGVILICFVYLSSGVKLIDEANAKFEDHSDDIETSVSKENPADVEVTISHEDILAAKIDKFHENSNSPLAGYGKDFVREARENNIDETIVAAIGWCESNGGKVTPQFNNQESYNAWGYAVFDNNSTTKNMNAYSMESWENGIALMSRAIKKYYDRGLVEPQEIVTRYTPASVRKGGGDPEKAPWTLCVKGTINKILAQQVQLSDASVNLE